jgi:hypothetical protein
MTDMGFTRVQNPGTLIASAGPNYTKNNGLGGIRTPDIQLRRLTPYPG